MTPERLRQLRQLHAVCVEADCRVSAKAFGECLDAIEGQAAALRRVLDAWERGELAYVEEGGGEAIEAVRKVLELEGKR